MTRIRRLPPVLFSILALLAGIGCLLAGVYLLAGLPWALITGGVLLGAVGLLVDV